MGSRKMTKLIMVRFLFANRYSISALISFFVLIVSICLDSRAFIVGSCAGLLFVQYVFGKVKKVLVCAIVVGVLLACLTIFHKKDSTQGRLLIYKVSFQMLQDNWLFGIGFNKFHQVYPKYQASYFSKNDFSTKELLLADNTYYAFNDYFQFLIEFGFSGFVILILSSVSIKNLYIKKIKGQLDLSFSLTVSVSLLLTILISAFFTHVFDVFVLRLIIIALLTVIFLRIYPNSPLVKLGVFIVGVSTLCVFVLSTPQLINYSAYQRFKKAKLLYDAGYIQESMQILNEITSDLKDCLEFENYCGSRFFALSDYKNAEKWLERANERMVYSVTYTTLGECYYKQNKNDRAECAFVMSINLVPNRFKSRFALFNFYKDTRQTKKAIACGQAILTLPIKIPSFKIEQIKSTIKAEVNQLKCLSDLR